MTAHEEALSAAARALAATPLSLNGHGPTPDASGALEPSAVEPGAAVEEDGQGAAEGPETADERAWTRVNDAVGSPENPLTTARAVEPLWWNEAGLLTVRRWRDEWLTWTGTCWEPADEAELRRQLYLLLEHARYTGVNGRGQAVPNKPWAPTRAKVSNVLDALAALVHTAAALEMPGWVDGTAEGGLTACANVLLDLVTGETRPHTAAYFNATALPFAHDPAATCPRWNAFLASVFPGDPASVTLLREWFGYVVSGRTDQQKMLYLVGSQRSGKGVIARTLTRLMGRENVAAPTLNGFATNFGLSSLIGKPLAVIADARSSPRVDTQLVVERLLLITGEDALDVDRKNRPIWTGRLPTRLMMASNETPWFRDASGAISSRLLVLVFRESFLGREDHALEADLAAELPGILNWAQAGLTGLAARGRFTVPAASAEVMAEIGEETSPIQAFLTEACVTGPHLQVAVNDLMREWLAWHGGLVLDTRAERTKLGRQLRAALPTLVKHRVTDGRGGKPYVYGGLALRADLEAEKMIFEGGVSEPAEGS